MDEYRFKVLKDGDIFYSFSDTEMIIRDKDGHYRIYKIFGFNEGKPQFSKEFEVVSACSEDIYNDKTVVIKKAGKIAVYKIEQIKKKVPILNTDFAVIVTNGIGKIEVFNAETRVTIQIPAKEC